jgi:tetratricopeptide (TPR) repeat protein
MARKLSRIAKSGILIAIAASAWLVVTRALADGAVQIAPTASTIQNPFAPETAAFQPTTAAPAESGPRMYQNPFTTGGNSSSAVTPLPHQNTLSRWRRPPQLPGTVQSPNPFSPATTAPPAINNSWDVLSPAELEAQHDTSNPPQRSPQPATSESPPDPGSYGSGELRQPSWLVPPQSSANIEALPPKELPYPPTAARLPRASGEADQTRPIATAIDAPTFGVRQPDPFETSDASESVVSDQTAPGPVRPQSVPSIPAKTHANAIAAASPIAASPIAAPSAVPTPPPQRLTRPESTARAALSPADCYERAQRVAVTAQSADELSRVVEICQQGLAAHPQKEMATRLRSLGAWARNRHGELESEAGHDAEALDDYKAALDFDPNCWLALHNRAVSFAQQGHGAEALRDFNRVIHLSPGMAIAYRNRGELLASMGRTEEAVADYGRAIAQLPDEADLYEIRGHALHRLGRYQDALADLDRAIELSPHNADAFAHRGNVYAELGDYSRATNDFQHAFELDGNCADAYRSLAWLESTCPDEQFRDAQQAVTAAERAAKLSPPGNCFVLDALAAAQANAGNFDAAVHYQKLAMANSPKSFEPQFAERLALYEQHQPYRNEVAASAPDRQVRAASLEAPANSLPSAGVR